MEEGRLTQAYLLHDEKRALWRPFLFARASRFGPLRAARVFACYRIDVKWIGRILVSVPVVLLLWHAGSEFLAVDACLDSGGAFDYGSANCRYDVQHVPYTSDTERFWGLIAGSA